MIEHVWTVLCERTHVDQDTGSVHMEVLDRVLWRTDLAAPMNQGEGRYLLPQRLDIISQWFRAAVQGDDEGLAELTLQGPSGHALLTVSVPIRFGDALQHRTRHIIAALPIAGPGVHRLVVTLRQGEQASLVAQIPLVVAEPRA